MATLNSTDEIFCIMTYVQTNYANHTKRSLKHYWTVATKTQFALDDRSFFLKQIKTKKNYSKYTLKSQH